MKPKPFIPAWLNQAGLSQADFRVYCCLAARADVKTGIAWPKAETIAIDCFMARRTVWKSLRSLEGKRLIRKNGKRFADSNRYQVLIPIGANEAPIEAPPIGANEAPIEAPPIGANEAPPIGANEAPPIGANEAPGRVTNKSNQRRVTKEEDSTDLPFASEEFREAWSDWKQHRAEIRKRLTPTSIKKQFKELSAFGEAAAIAAIDHSISKGWTGIFPATATTGNPSKATINTGNRAATIEDV